LLLFPTSSLAVAGLSLPGVLSFLAENVFWMLLLGWVLLVIATLDLGRSSPCQSYLGEEISDTGHTPVQFVWKPKTSDPAPERLADPIL
jgi:hypothetical protein